MEEEDRAYYVASVVKRVLVTSQLAGRNYPPNQGDATVHRGCKKIIPSIVVSQPPERLYRKPAALIGILSE